jgi:hypothetical protein
MSYLLKTKPARIAIALILSLALIFGLAPLLPSGTASADGGPTVLTVVFRDGGQVVGEVEYDEEDLEYLAETDTAYGYIALEGTKYVTYTTQNYIEIQDLLWDAADDPSWAFNSSMTIYLGNNDKSTYGYQDVKNGRFYGETGPTTAVEDDATPSPLVLALTGEKRDIGTTAADNVSAYDDSGAGDNLIDLTMMAGWLSNNTDKSFADYATGQATYGNQTSRRRISTGVDKIVVDVPGALNSLQVYTTVGTDPGNSVSDPDASPSYSAIKSYGSRAALEAIAKSEKLNYQWGSQSAGWSIASVNQYITISDLLRDAGVVFNEGDSLRIFGTGDFTRALTFEQVQEMKYFYPGTNPGAIDVGGETAAPPIIAISRAESRLVENAAAQIAGLNEASYVDKSGRFLIGASKTDYQATSVAGQPLVSGAFAVAVIKDGVDTIADSDVTLDQAEYIADGKQIKPIVTVKSGGLTLKEGIGYDVKYGDNKNVGNGSVVVTGKGLFTGVVTKTFTIKAPSIDPVVEPKITIAKIADQTYNGKAKKPALTVKADGKLLTPVTDYTAVYSNNTKIGKATAKVTIKAGKTYTATFKINPKKTAGFKLKALKKSFKASWKKDSQATGYQIQYSINKKIAKGIKKYTAKKKTVVTRTFKSLKSKKTYYAKIRTYKTVSGVKYYSAWSKIIRIKIK